MPRFVSKEDVQKGLVDPTKPLKDQPEYQKKLDQETKNKQPKHDESKVQKKLKKQRDQQGNKQQNNDEKNQDKQRKPKRQRDNRPQYNWNKRQITLQTPVPEALKKILPKPDQTKFEEAIKKLKDQRQALYQLRKKLIEEQNFLIKSNSQTKKGGFNALSKYSGELKQKNNLKNIVDGKIKKLEQQRIQVEQKIKDLKQINGNLLKPKGLESYTTQSLKNRIQELQHKLSTANLDKKQEANINNDINLAKRALLKSKPQIQIKTEISKNDDNIKILYDQSRALKKQIDASYSQLKPIKQQIYILLQKRKQQEGTITEVRSFEQIKAEYDQKIKANDAKRQQLKKKMDELYEKNHKQNDAYYDQQDLLRYIKYVQQQKQYKKKRVEEQQKRKKEKQQREKQKQKQYEERQRKKQQRKKQEEQRIKRQQQRRQKLQKQREEFINRNPNHSKIDVCNFMITYCLNLKPDTIKKQTQQEKNIKLQQLNLAKQKGWQKQAKNGCAVIVSKKDKLDEEVKKVKKEKKKRQTEDDGSIHHNIDTINIFHDLNILPPSNISELDKTIQQLQEKIELYNKPSEEEINTFKANAQIEFDRIYGLTQKSQPQEDQNQEQKPSRNERKKEKAEKVQLKVSDFPELN